MTLPEPKACTACANCAFVGGIYLCTLPPECFDLGEHHPYDDEEDTIEWLGMNCDRSRRQGEFCGPAGKSWRPRSA
jgi:hypothetical protein